MTDPAAPPATVLTGPSLPRVHLIAIGGAGMSAIARILLARGGAVSGSDSADGPTLAALRGLGATTFVGHDAANLAGAEVVVVSSAIRAANPELVEARRRGIPVLHRAAALAQLASGHRVIAVAGTHGKTTTSSMITVALRHAGLDPSFAIGGELRDTGTNAHAGTGEVFVIEADESDGSFLQFRPEIAVVTNVEPEHLDHYGDGAAVTQAFHDFAGQVSAAVITCADDPGGRELAAWLRGRGRPVLTYGAADDTDATVEELELPAAGGSRFTLRDDAEAVPVALQVTGGHYVLDAAAAYLACRQITRDTAAIVTGLATFTGAKRRMEDKGSAAGVRVIDSYAHHQTELAADLAAARQLAGGGRILAVFQPHLYSRTLSFAAELGTALGAADEVVVLDVYGAREAPVEGVDGTLVARAVPLPEGDVHYIADRSAVPHEVASLVRPGDLVITLGAGDVTQVGPDLLELLRQM